MEHKYQAFVSYSHADVAFAKWLFGALENYRLPKDVSVPGGAPATRRLGRFFKDEDELAAAPSLGSVIETALTQSRTLIVVCSPEAARSQWVAREIEFFCETLGRDRVFAVLARGEPNAADPDLECFPPAFRRAGRDPLAADFRSLKPGERREALVRLVAGLCDLDFDALRRRELSRARASAIRSGAIAIGAVALAATAGIASAVAMYANRQLAQALSSESEARQAAQQALNREREARAAEEAANQTAASFQESGAELFVSVNESAIGYAQTLIGWSAPMTAPTLAVLLGEAQEGPHSDSENAYWQRCPRTLANCFPARTSRERATLEIVATQGEAEEVVSAPARRAFLEMCQRFTGAPNLAVLRACRGERQWDLDASWYPVALAAAIDSARGYAVFQMRSSGYCGSGGCNFPIELWLRRADGAYASALRDDDLVTADEAAVVLGDGATELVVVNRGQAGIAAQFATVSRFRLRQTETHMTRVAHFFFREDLGSVQPILTVCAEPFSGVLSEQENC